jgi:hypothetical protein
MTRYRIAVTLAVTLWAAAPAFAQQAGKGPARYDATAETTVAGTVTSVMSAASADGVVGVHLQVKTPAGLVHVHLGPAVFIGDNNFFFIADDEVSIVGAKVGGKDPVVWARSVTKDGKTLTLRNADGTPRWTLATADDPDGCGVAHGPIR